MAKWYDGFMFYNELDMAELRFAALYAAVDTFVIVESGMTHSGQPKGTPFADALAGGRFAAYADKIHYHYLPTLPGPHAWAREAANRAAIADAARRAGITANDWLLVSDCDEIITPEAVEQLKHTRSASAAKFELAFMYYDYHHRVRQGWAVGACRWQVQQDANKIRTCDFPGVQPVVFWKGGWHLSYFGSAETNLAKTQAFMHHDWLDRTPLTAGTIQDAMTAGVDIWGRDLVIEYVPTPGSLPAPVLANPQHYVELGWLEAQYALQVETAL